jgi:hypothetical protein
LFLWFVTAAPATHCLCPCCQQARLADALAVRGLTGRRAVPPFAQRGHGQFGRDHRGRQPHSLTAAEGLPQFQHGQVVGAGGCGSGQHTARGQWCWVDARVRRLTRFPFIVGCLAMLVHAAFARQCLGAARATPRELWRGVVYFVMTDHPIVVGPTRVCVIALAICGAPMFEPKKFTLRMFFFSSKPHPAPTVGHHVSREAGEKKKKDRGRVCGWVWVGG